MYKLNTLLIIIFNIMILHGCTSNNIEGKNCYKTILVDSTFFNKDWLIILEDENKMKKFIISEKKNSLSDKYLKYDSLTTNKNICIEIKKVDTLVNASLKGIKSQDDPEIYLDGKLIWSEGFIRVTLYISDCIQDKIYN